jgi:hypothetical protein
VPCSQPNTFPIRFYCRSRTKATAAQQKEANNINMSLMQLWRCLQGMKKKVRYYTPLYG